MICYRDMTFCQGCPGEYDPEGCGRDVRHLNPGGKLYEAYQEWSASFSDGVGPVAMTHTCICHERGLLDDAA